MIAREFPAEKMSERTVLTDAFEALISLGYTAPEARQKIDAVADTKQKFKTVEDVILAIYQLGRD